MTPKEKSEELVDKFIPYRNEIGDEHTCALITVEELIAETGAKYWYEVKQEIEKL